MADDLTNVAVTDEAARGALAYLTELSPDLRGAAILDSGGVVLAASDSPERWREDAVALLAVADRAGEGPVEQLHVGTEQGEVFAVREESLALVAVTDRFALASLLFFDMRSVLRDLAGGGDGRGLDGGPGDAP